MFSSVLVANRGEIAVRVVRTCRRLGIRAVAVHSDADARGVHVRVADESVRIGPAPAAESYLRADAIIAAAVATGAEAIHPGYGFLAESSAFADAVLAAGLAWVGPPPAAMRALGDKARARALAEAHGVPVLPGYHGDATTDEELAARAAGIGFPVLVKATAGGGGRGMRVAESADGLAEALAAARREALAAFGDDRLLLERYVRRPRHVEVQVIGDHHGALVHLGERECSVQRRHQKLVEESPSPAVTPELRAAMTDAALRLARAAGYANAGTVEFLLDETGAFFFLEVNARLQVEHPVTELVTGLDLVELQLRVAAGEPLPLSQDAVRLDGHAMELRLVAEDPAAGFLPATGRITAFEPPRGVRTDAGIETGSEVSPFYDSLLAKVIAHGRDREDTLARLRAALEETRLDGVPTNLALLDALLDEPAFVAGDLHTGFLDEHRVAGRVADAPDAAVAAAAGVASLAPGSVPGEGPWRTSGPWRLARTDEPGRWIAGGRQRVTATSLVPDRSSAAVSVDGAGPVDVRVTGGGPEAGWETSIAGARAAVRPAGPRRPATIVALEGRRHRVAAAAPPGTDVAESTAGHLHAGIVAPMPGRVVRVTVTPGDAVLANAPLVILEAMKMEHVVVAPGAGTVSAVQVAAGDQVVRGATLVELDGGEAG